MQVHKGLTHFGQNDCVCDSHLGKRITGEEWHVSSRQAHAQKTVQGSGVASLTAALLDRLTHRCHIHEFDWESIRLTKSLQRQGKKLLPSRSSGHW